MAASQGELDITLAASGFKSTHQAVLEQYVAQQSDGDTADDSSSGDEPSASSSAESKYEHEPLAEGRLSEEATCNPESANEMGPASHAVGPATADVSSPSQRSVKLDEDLPDTDCAKSLESSEHNAGDCESNAEQLTADAGHDRLGQVRRQIAAERKSKQNQGIQARAAKGARQAAARQGRKAIAQTM